MIDVDAAKAWVKKETDDEDVLIAGLVSAAVATIEAQTGKNMSAKDFELSLAGFPRRAPFEIAFVRGPVTEISAIAYDPDDGSAEDTVDDFQLVEGYGRSFNGVVRPAFDAVWPTSVRGSGTVRISGTAGYAEDEAPELDQAALMLVAHWYHNREAVSGGPANELPLAVRMLIRPYCPPGVV